MNLIKQFLKILETIILQITKAFLVVLYLFVFVLGTIFITALIYGGIKELQKTYENSTIQTPQSPRK